MKISFFTTPGLLLFLLLGVSTSFAQERINFAGGTGTPEMVNVGLRLQVDQNQYGINAGTNLAYKHNNISLSGDYYYHFAGRSRFSSLRPWFIKTGLTYMLSQDEWEKHMNLVLVPRLGREFNITPQFGVALEAGVMIMLMDRNEAKKERTDAISGDLDLIGSGPLQASYGLKFFYRLQTN